MPTTGRRPSRSVSQPNTGAKANIPAMCALRTSPTSRSVCAASCPALRMCTGVMVMTPTITTCPIAMAPTPSRAAGRDRITGSAARTPLRRAPPGTAAGAPAMVSRDHGGVRPQQQEQHQRPRARTAGPRRRTAPPAWARRSGQRRARGRGEARTDDRAQRGRPHDEREMPPAERVGREVHRGVARLVSRGRGAAEEEEAGEQERHRAAHRGGDDEERSHRRQGVPGREARPAAAALHDGRGRHGEEGGAHDVGALGHAREADPGDVRGQQRADRRRRPRCRRRR